MHGVPARVRARNVGLALNLRFLSQRLGAWGWSQIFAAPRLSAKALKPASVGVPTFVRPRCALSVPLFPICRGAETAK